MSFYQMLVSAIIGGTLFQLLHLPLAWLLGAMIGTIAFIKLTKQTPKLPFSFRTYALIPIGYTIGENFNKQTLMDMVTHLPSMLVLTICLILFSLLLAVVTNKLTHSNLKSTIAGSIPGGLTQMVAISSEIKGIDLTVVTIIQVSRIMTVVMLVPFIVYSPIFHAGSTAVASANAEGVNWLFLFFLVISYAAGAVAKKCKFPTPYMLGPLIIIAGLLLIGMDVPAIPVPVIAAAQVMMGIDLGMQMKFGEIENKPRFLAVSIISSIVLVGFSFVLSAILLGIEENISLLTAFIGLAPGGMAEMALLGQAVKADLTIITTYQLFRLLFILFIVPLIMRKVFLFVERRQAAKVVIK
ncbi:MULTISPECIES: AbrB family transcriptional regulator [unclassified Niallia]|uniref:AbrB family transcriptional regulator n=1 Tax=unclassified Niallia TaxID=2837522 RepID=UPI001EDBBF55|nr:MULTISPECIES: AbrB family transcriptional regulator [unclassified Niallia]MCM3031147.1 AbrB family transcriptional regulator [Niallia sp. MER 6]MDL0434723.1 AbrB family transcriptional regulator [Niallia sp. SS-2023]UPO85962.1 AbrB family transcriptional regulator [Niallia sp. Man26]